MNNFCPIVNKQVNEYVCRSNAALTVILVVLFLLTSAFWLIWLLAVDFFIRGFIDSQYSLTGFLSRYLIGSFLPKKMINAGPKIFAAQIGFIFSVLAAILFFVHLHLASFVVAGVLGLFALLEFTIGFCMACQVYPLIRKIR